MSEAFDPFNLLILAIAIVIFLRLRSVLGRRTGSEREPYDPYSSPGAADGRSKDLSNDGKVITLPGHERDRQTDISVDEEGGPAPIWDGFAEKGTPLADALEKIATVDAGFNPHRFIEGARIAYEMIVTAFAEGDRKTLKNLLSREVYDGFDEVIVNREKRGETVESSFVGIDKASIIEASLKSKTANVTVKFISQLISATKDKEGRIIDGDPKKVREVTDIWTFMRDVASKDPNWRLVATKPAN